MADIDFLPSLNLYSLITSSLDGLDGVDRGEVAVIVPAFETVNGGCESGEECEGMVELVPESFEGIKEVRRTLFASEGEQRVEDEDERQSEE